MDQTQLLQWIAVSIGAYLVGSANLSIFASRLVGSRDPRSAGSGNPGATNLLRTGGPKLAVPVLVLDIAKASATIWIAQLLIAPGFEPLIALPLLLGNLFPLFFGFRGGKGIATVVGAFLAISPLVMLLGGVVFLLVVSVGRRVSLGSLLMTASYPVWLLLLHHPAPVVYVSLLVLALSLWTHRHNLRRLVRGEEPRITLFSSRKNRSVP